MTNEEKELLKGILKMNKGILEGLQEDVEREKAMGIPDPGFLKEIERKIKGTEDIIELLKKRLDE